MNKDQTIALLSSQVEEYAFKTVTLAQWFAEAEAERLSTTAWESDVEDILRDVDDMWYEEDMDRMNRRSY